MRHAPSVVNDYIDHCRPKGQAALRKIQAMILKVQPAIAVTLSYGMPTYSMGQRKIHVGAFKNHIGLFPPVKNPELRDKLQKYKGEKGSLRFPLNEPYLMT